MDLNIQTTRIYNDVNSNHKIIILRGGSRSSKTYTAIQWCVVQALSKPNIVISIVRKTFPSIKKSVMRDFNHIMNELNIYKIDNWSASDNIYSFDNGSIIEFVSVSDSERIKGSKRDYLLIDEANELTYEDFQQLFIRTSQKTILAFNPSFNRNTHWIYTTVLQHPDCKEFISTYKDNPFLEESIVVELERMQTISPSYYRVYTLGEFGQTDGVIFDNFSVIDNLPDLVPLGYGLDFGFSNDPSAMVVVFKYEGGIILHECCYKTGLLSSDLAQMILQQYNLYGRCMVYSDVDPRLVHELSRYNGVVISQAIKGPNSIHIGIDIMKQYKIYITKSSVNLINEFMNYTWSKNRSGEFTDIPTGPDHAIDAARYVCNMLLSKRAQPTNITLSFV